MYNTFYWWKNVENKSNGAVVCKIGITWLRFWQRFSIWFMGKLINGIFICIYITSTVISTISYTMQIQRTTFIACIDQCAVHPISFWMQNMFRWFCTFPYASMSPVSCIQAKHIFRLTLVALEVHIKFIQWRYENADQHKNQNDDEK